MNMLRTSILHASYIYTQRNLYSVEKKIQQGVTALHGREQTSWAKPQELRENAGILTRREHVEIKLRILKKGEHRIYGMAVIQL